MASPQVVIYTDGSCHGNPGPGGYAAILRFGKHRKELSGGYRLTTNNRMELRAAVVALAALKEPCKVAFYSDSKYLLDSIEKGWAKRWRANGWWKGKKLKDPVLNFDIWDELLPLLEPHDISWHWVKGHAGNEENERCDELANAAAEGPEKAEDGGYGQSPPPRDGSSLF